jgi:CDP-diacylglycerol--serine O-phosphatidyltransferase
MSRNRKIDMHNKPTLKRVAVIPTLMTLANCVCGFMAIHFTARGMVSPDEIVFAKWGVTFYALAAGMIFMGMVCDMLDGHLARLADSASDFGGQLDSMSDMVSFGAAPAFLMMHLFGDVWRAEVGGPVSLFFGNSFSRIVWIVAAIYVSCTALRLARYNVENSPDAESHKTFKGLPCPAAAGVIASLCFLYCYLTNNIEASIAPIFSKYFSTMIISSLPIITLGLSFLMVSQISYDHIVSKLTQGRKPFGYVAMFVIALMLLWWQFPITIAVGFIAFAIVPVIKTIIHWQKKRRNSKTINYEPTFNNITDVDNDDATE